MAVISQEASAATEGAGVERLKDAAAAALITFFLCFPIILLHAEADNDGALYLTWRPWAVVVLCALAFIGRYAILAYAARPKAAAVAAAPAEAPLDLAPYADDL